jgi:aromatic-L-amino-acid decarboxylase
MELDNTLANLEHTARQLEPSPATRNAWNAAVQAYADRFIDQIEDIKAFVTGKEQGVGLPAFGLEESGRPIDDLLEVLQEQVDTPGLNPASGGHLGYVPGGGIFPTALGDYLADVTNRYAGVFFAGPGAVRMENQLIRWMCGLVGYPDTALGNLTSGGSIANLIAVTTARDKMGIRARAVERAVVYLSVQTHHCVHKALRIAGLVECVLREVPLDAGFRMDAAALSGMIEADKKAGLLPFLVVASAGTTDTGVVDPLDAIADIAQAEGLWFHIDAAYGGFFTLVDSLRPRFKGIERSDSIAIDPHKGLFLAYGTGAVLVRDVPALFQSHYYKANYMQDALGDYDELSPADLSPELTKPFRGLRMWLPLQLFGLAPFRAALEEKALLCRYFYEKVQALGFEVGPPPELSIMIFRYVPETGDADAFNAKLVQFVHDDGRVFITSTRINGVFWIRLAVLSFRTHRREIDICLEVLGKGVE